MRGERKRNQIIEVIVQAIASINKKHNDNSATDIRYSKELVVPQI